MNRSFFGNQEWFSTSSHVPARTPMQVGNQTELTDKARQMVVLRI
ncbi:MAG TPA: hypothetical protein VJ991_07785 [Balneolales bacterium]|nr:hypothetical protein [Balneolales bacterium]